MEITITGANAMAFPHIHIWDWRVSLYLFLGGLSAGLAVMVAVMHIGRGKREGLDAVSWIAPLLVPLILAIGMFFIFLDLERKLYVFWFYLTVQPLSPMSWGSWGLLGFFPLSILFALAVLPQQHYGYLRLPQLQRFAARLRPFTEYLALANLGMGILIGIYTGVLLSSFIARPFWNSAILPLLFLISALSSGAALMIILARQKQIKLLFTKIEILLIAAEMIVLPLFFYGQYTSSGAHRASILPFFAFTHEYLWYSVAILLIGVIFPFALVLKLLEVRIDHGEELSAKVVGRMHLSAALVLAGALIIRLAFVYAGQLSKFV